jgi:hypothetical protein
MFDPFVLLCQAHGVPVPVREYRFHPPRLWRFDYAWPALKVALEQEGGAFTNGRHTRGTGFVHDLEKYNTAILDGWKVFRVTPQQIRSGDVLQWIQQPAFWSSSL